MEPKKRAFGGIYENLVPYPLNFYTFDPIYVVTFLISCKILWILRGSWVNILCILCHLHSFGFGSGLVTELNQSHQHGQTESSDQNVEDPSHVAQAEGARLLLRSAHETPVSGGDTGERPKENTNPTKIMERNKSCTTIALNIYMDIYKFLTFKMTKRQKQTLFHWR